MAEPVIAQKAPYSAAVEAGKTYWWCACGKSTKQPFCDGSHKGGEFAPKPYTVSVGKATSPPSRRICAASLIERFIFIRSGPTCFYEHEVCMNQRFEIAIEHPVYVADVHPDEPNFNRADGVPVVPAAAGGPRPDGPGGQRRPGGRRRRGGRRPGSGGPQGGGNR